MGKEYGRSVGRGSRLPLVVVSFTQPPQTSWDTCVNAPKGGMPANIRPLPREHRTAMFSFEVNKSKAPDTVFGQYRQTIEAGSFMLNL